MGISSLNYDVLRHLFSAVRKGYRLSNRGDYSQLIAISSVCRAWRGLLVPCLYESIYISYDACSTKSNVDLILEAGCSRHVRKLELIVDNVSVEYCSVVGILNKSGVAQTAWPQIKRLEIHNWAGECDMEEDDSIQRIYYDDGDLDFDEKEAVDFLGSYLPNLQEILYYRDIWDEYSSEYYRAEYSSLLFSGLVDQYSTQLQRLYLRYSAFIAENLSFPKQLTHLELINEEDIWFDSLRKFSIEFKYSPYEPLRVYHNGCLSLVDVHKFESDYSDVYVQVHFPVLEKLKIRGYPYEDNSFYRLFENSPLMVVDVESPKRVHFHIPPQLLASPADLTTYLFYDARQFKAGDEMYEPSTSKSDVYQEAISRLLSSPSAVQSARIWIEHSGTISVPDTLKWNRVQVLDLEFDTSIRSLYTILAQMPNLRHLRFALHKEYQLGCNNKDSGVNETEQQLRVVNKCVEYLQIYTYRSGFESQKTSLLFYMSCLLPLVPSLMKLETSIDLVGAAAEYIADPSNPLQRMSQQLEIAWF
ncbi:hypothetical protein GGI12_004217 [Dipsacomyces acuminosporus]|nr:hypothetical protein GGI12_004217 [Dipsacomyces acuminosporus]